MELDLTDRQLDVMNILWDRGSATVREVKREIERQLAYTSVLTLFRTLEENDFVHHEQEGRAYRYYPTVSRKEAGKAAVEYLLRRVFYDSPAALLGALMNLRSWSDDERTNLRHHLNEATE